LFAGASAEVSGGERVETAAGEAKLVGSLGGLERAVAKGGEDIADERRRVTMGELLVVFKGWRIPCRPVPAASLFVGLRSARPPPRLAAGTGVVLLC